MPGNDMHFRFSMWRAECTVTGRHSGLMYSVCMYMGDLAARRPFFYALVYFGAHIHGSSY